MSSQYEVGLRGLNALLPSLVNLLSPRRAGNGIQEFNSLIKSRGHLICTKKNNIDQNNRSHEII
jgi:hypothetical protein